MMHIPPQRLFVRSRSVAECHDHYEERTLILFFATVAGCGELLGVIQDALRSCRYQRLSARPEEGMCAAMLPPMPADDRAILKMVERPIYDHGLNFELVIGGTAAGYRYLSEWISDSTRTCGEHSPTGGAVLDDTTSAVVRPRSVALRCFSPVAALTREGLREWADIALHDHQAALPPVSATRYERQGYVELGYDDGCFAKL